jgi:hypothetical protein
VASGGVGALLWQTVARWHWAVAWRASGPAGGSGVGWWPACSFSVSWYVEAFHRLGVQGAKVSALPGALPQPRVCPASHQGP